MVVFVLPTPASAAANAGVKPGSFFYFFDTTFEKLGLFFTFNPEKKAKKALDYAGERLAEIEVIAGGKNPNVIKTVIANYESNVALATEKSKEIKDKGQAESLFTSIADNTSKYQEILAEVLAKVPDEAKETITKAIEASRKGQEEATKQIAELKSEVEKLKKEVAKLKQESVQNVSSETIKSDNKKIESQSVEIEKNIQKEVNIKTETKQKSQTLKEQQEQIQNLQEEIIKINNSLKIPCPYSDKVPSCYIPCPDKQTDYCFSEWISKKEYVLNRTSNSKFIDVNNSNWSVYFGEWWTNGPSDQFRPIINEPITLTYGDQIITSNTDEKGIAHFNLYLLGKEGSNSAIYSSRFITTNTYINEY